MEEKFPYGCKMCSNLSRSIFKVLKSEEFDLISLKQTCSIYKKGDILYREGSRITGFYCVKTGSFKIYKTGVDYKPQIIAFARSGDITGYRSVLSNEPACTTCEALEESEVCYIPGTIIFELIKSNPDFALTIIQLTCKELDHANIFIKDIAQKTVRERLAEILFMLRDAFGTDENGFIAVSLTREDLSSIVGTATESVIRILSEFKNEKLLELKGKRIKMINEKKLKLISESILK